MSLIYWQPMRRNKGWLSYLNRKLLARQTIDQRRSSLATVIAHPGLPLSKITPRFESTVARRGGPIPNGRELRSRPKNRTELSETLLFPGLVLALLFSGVVTAAYTDQPVFWLLVGPAPFAVAYTLRTCLRRPLVRREGLLVLCEQDR